MKNEEVEVKVRLDVELVEWLDRECEGRERSRSFVVAEVMRKRMKDLNKRRKVPFVYQGGK